MKNTISYFSFILYINGVIGGEIQCNNLFSSITSHLPPAIPYGSCILTNSSHQGQSLIIKTVQSNIESEIETTEIAPHTIFSILPKRTNRRMIAPDHVRFKDFSRSFHGLTTYIERKTSEAVFCSPFHCLFLPFNLENQNFFFDFLVNVREYNCPEEQLLIIDYSNNSNEPYGICIRKNNDNDTGKPFVSTNPSSSFFYLAMTPLEKIGTISNTSDKRKSALISSNASKHVGSGVIFYSHNLSSALPPFSNHIALSHNLFPLIPREKRLYVVKTPIKVYSLLEDHNGTLQLFSEPPLGKPPSFLSISKKGLNGAFLSKIEINKRISEEGRERERGEEERDEEGEEKRGGRVVIQVLENDENWFKRPLPESAKYSAMYHHPYGYISTRTDTVWTGALALRAFLRFEGNWAGEEWREEGEIGEERGVEGEERGEERFIANDITITDADYLILGHAYLYSMLTYWRSKGWKEELQRAKEVISCFRYGVDWDELGRGLQGRVREEGEIDGEETEEMIERDWREERERAQGSAFEEGGVREKEQGIEGEKERGESDRREEERNETEKRGEEEIESERKEETERKETERREMERKETDKMERGKDESGGEGRIRVQSAFLWSWQRVAVIMCFFLILWSMMIAIHISKKGKEVKSENLMEEEEERATQYA